MFRPHLQALHTNDGDGLEKEDKTGGLGGEGAAPPPPPPICKRNARMMGLKNQCA